MTTRIFGYMVSKRQCLLLSVGLSLTFTHRHNRLIYIIQNRVTYKQQKSNLMFDSPSYGLVSSSAD